MTTAQRTAWLPAFVLHARPFRERDWLLELLTPEQGRVAAIGRSPRPELFRDLSVRLTGHSSLQRLADWRFSGRRTLHDGAALRLGLYFNELCVRLVPRHQSDPTFFGVYASSLMTLSDPGRRQAARCFFERRLLESAGYGIDYRRTLDSGDWVRADGRYGFDPALGVCSRNGPVTIPGQALLAMADNDWRLTSVRDWALWLHAARIDYLLEGRPLVSRQSLPTTLQEN